MHEDGRCVLTYINKIFHLSMVYSLSQPDLKIMINFLDSIVFFFHILQEIGIC